MKKILLIVVTIFVTNSCTDVDSATKTLKQNGYKPIEVGGYDYFAKSENEQFSTRFKAISVTGDTITGAVTKRALGSSTIRLD